MRARTINETTSFQRYKDPKKALFPDMTNDEIMDWFNEHFEELDEIEEEMAHELRVPAKDWVKVFNKKVRELIPLPSNDKRNLCKMYSSSSEPPDPYQ